MIDPIRKNSGQTLCVIWFRRVRRIAAAREVRRDDVVAFFQDGNIPDPMIPSTEAAMQQDDNGTRRVIIAPASPYERTVPAGRIMLAGSCQQGLEKLFRIGCRHIGGLSRARLLARQIARHHSVIARELRSEKDQRRMVEPVVYPYDTHIQDTGDDLGQWHHSGSGLARAEAYAGLTDGAP